MSVKVSPYFKRPEFACKCGCGFDTVDTVLLEALEAIRGHFESAVVITSGCRCIAHNAAIGGSEKSQHLKGRAADIQVKMVEPERIANYAEDLGMSVGRYSTFTHIDSRSGTPAKWG
tara:strand:- start:419 stop:769 length:351 start_codon:yes stop_codon:yes gene_type:complete